MSLNRDGMVGWTDGLCGRCDKDASVRGCPGCNENLCENCMLLPCGEVFSPPKGSAPGLLPGSGGGAASPSGGSGAGEFSLPHCDVHGLVLLYLCESCKKDLCQECKLCEHKDHSCIPLPHGAPHRLHAVYVSGHVGMKCVQWSIDRAATFSEAVELDAIEASASIRAAMHRFRLAVDDRERTLLERVDQFRQLKLISLSDQKARLQTVLTNMSLTSDFLTKAFASLPMMSSAETAKAVMTCESLMELYVATYRELQPSQDFITFAEPNLELLQEIRRQGDVMLVGQRSNSVSSVAGMSGLQGEPPGGSIGSGVPRSGNGGVEPGGGGVPGPRLMPVGPGLTFGVGGHEDGQVSPTWFITVGNDGLMLVADRSNQLVQIFYPDGTIHLTFGSPGSANGQFGQPADGGAASSP